MALLDDEQPLEIKFKKLHPKATLPSKNHNAACFDLYAVPQSKETFGPSVIINPLTRATIPLGISWEPPIGYSGHIRDRSGLAAKHGIHVLAGEIDNDYRGEIMVCLLNTSDKPYQITCGDKIAQIKIEKDYNIESVWSDDLSETERGEQGFGSSGK